MPVDTRTRGLVQESAAERRQKGREATTLEGRTCARAAAGDWRAVAMWWRRHSTTARALKCQESSQPHSTSRESRHVRHESATRRPRRVDTDGDARTTALAATTRRETVSDMAVCE